MNSAKAQPFKKGSAIAQTFKKGSAMAQTPKFGVSTLAKLHLGVWPNYMPLNWGLAKVFAPLMAIDH